MPLYSFQGYKGRKSVSYVCATCGKKRSKTFTVEHTVNPYNKDENGVPKQAARVQADAIADAAAEATAFLRMPLCSKCEPNTYAEQKRIRQLRREPLPTPHP